MSRKFRSALLVLAAGASLGGCATMQRQTAAYLGNRPDLNPVDVAEFRAGQEANLDQFVQLAGTPNLRNGGDWNPVVDAGMHYVDVRCSRFMDALFWFNRVRDATSRQIQYSGAAASAAMTLLSAGRDLLGLAPMAFALADQTVNNIGQGLLYNLNPGTVLGLVERRQAAYRAGLAGVHFTTRGAALRAIQGYAQICLPAAIETEVGRAIEMSEFQAVDHRRPLPGVDGDGGTAAPPPAPPAPANAIPVVRQAPAPGAG